MNARQQLSYDDGPLYSPGEEMWRLMLPSLDHYQVLCVGYSAGESDIRSAYRALIRQFHPDNPVSGDADVTRRVIDAYVVLSNPSEKRSYDATLSSRLGSSAPSAQGSASSGEGAWSPSGGDYASTGTGSTVFDSSPGSSAAGVHAEPRFESFQWVSRSAGSSCSSPSRNPWVWLWVLYSSVVLGAFLGSSGLWHVLNREPSGVPGASVLPVQAPSFWLGVVCAAVVALLGAAVLRRVLLRWLSARWALPLSAVVSFVLSTVAFSLR